MELFSIKIRCTFQLVSTLQFDDVINTINKNINSATVDDFHKASLKSFFYELLEPASRLKI